MPKQADPNSLIHHLRTTLGKMEVALDAVTDAIVWTNELGKIQWCNALFEKLIQKKQLMLLGKKLPDILQLSQANQALPPEKHPGSLALTQTCQGTDFYEFYRNDTLHILEISWASIQFNDAQDNDVPATSAVLAIRDVTEKKQAEAELEKYRAQLESLVEQRTSELSTVNEHLQAELSERQRIEKLLVRSEAAIRALYEVTSTPKLDFSQSVEELLNFGCQQFNLPIGVLSKIQDNQYEIYLARLPNKKCVQGITLELENTYCHKVIETKKPLSILTAGATSWANSDCYQSLKLETYFGTPILVDGEIYGTLNFSSQTVREESFNALDKELLRLMAQWVGREIERQQSEITLAKARDDALAATKAKSDFLATMSHEIRTPMNGVIGMTSLLLDTALTDEQRNFVNTVRNSGNALLTLINDILDFSKIESGHLELEVHPFDLRSCIEEAFDLITSKASEKQLELAFQIEPGIPNMLVGDVTRLRQVLVNLLGNAVKFTHQGEITIAVTSWKSSTEQSSSYRAGNHCKLCFAVKDTGIGIPPERTERLFKAFSQVDSSTTRKYGGTGLGLAISKQLVEMMGGKIWVESQINQGSTFFFTVEAPTVSEQSEKHSPRSSQFPSQLVGKRLLIVDDNATNRKILEKQAQSWGMLTQVTCSGAEALNCFERGESFDLAILDMQMPEMDGLTLAQKIHTLPKQGKLPLVMLTSIGQYQVSQKEVEKHFVAFLNKPIKQAQLLKNLISIFEGNSIRLNQSKKSASKIDHDLGKTHPLHILLAEDNGVNQQLATQLLQRMGYRADVVGNGLEAVNALERQFYDVILMDLQMPEMDGLTATKTIRERWPSANGPWIIAVTANAMQGDREACIQAGMDDYVSKPIQIEALVTALKRVSPRAQREQPGQISIDKVGKQGQKQEPLAQQNDENDCVEDKQLSDSVTDKQEQEQSLQQNGDVDSLDRKQLIESIIDKEQLRNLMSAMGDKSFLAQLIETYTSESPNLIEIIERAIAQDDTSGLAHGAHTLKSSSKALGMTELSNLCQTLENMGREEKMEKNHITKLFEQLQSEYDKAVDVLTGDLDELTVICGI